MPIRIHWANNSKSIAIQKFQDVWTWEQVRDSYHEQLYPQLMELFHPVVVIQDMVGSHWKPTFHLLQDIRKLMDVPQPDNLRLMLVVSGEAGLDALIASAYKRYSQPHQIYESAPSVNAAIRTATSFLNTQIQPAYR